MEAVKNPKFAKTIYNADGSKNKDSTTKDPLTLQYWKKTKKYILKQVAKLVGRKSKYYTNGDIPVYQTSAISNNATIEKEKESINPNKLKTNMEQFVFGTIHKNIAQTDFIISLMVRDEYPDLTSPATIESLVDQYKLSGEAYKKILAFKKKSKKILDVEGLTFDQLADYLIGSKKQRDFMKANFTQLENNIIDAVYQVSEGRNSKGNVEGSIILTSTYGMHVRKSYEKGIDIKLKEGETNCVLKLFTEKLPDFDFSNFISPDEKNNGVSSSRSRIEKFVKDVANEADVNISFIMKNILNENIYKINYGNCRRKIGNKVHNIVGYQYGNHITSDNPYKRYKPNDENTKRTYLKDDAFLDALFDTTDVIVNFQLIPVPKALSFYSHDRNEIVYLDNIADRNEETKDDDTPMTDYMRKFRKLHKPISNNNKLIHYYSGENKITRKILSGRVYNNEDCLDPLVIGEEQIIDARSAYANAIKDCEYSYNKDGTRWITGPPSEMLYSCDNTIFNKPVAGLVFCRIIELPPYWRFRNDTSEKNINMFDLGEKAMNFKEAKFWYEELGDKYFQAYAINPSHRIPDTITPFFDSIPNNPQKKIIVNSIIGQFILRKTAHKLTAHSKAEADMLYDALIDVAHDKTDPKVHQISYLNKFFLTQECDASNNLTYPHLHSDIIACHRIKMFQKMSEIKSYGGTILELKTDSIRFAIKYNEQQQILSKQRLNIDDHENGYSLSTILRHMEKAKYIYDEKILDVKIQHDEYDNVFLENGKWKYEYYKPSIVNSLLHSENNYVCNTDNIKPFNDDFLGMYKAWRGAAGTGKTYHLSEVYDKNCITGIAPTHVALKNLDCGVHTVQGLIKLLQSKINKNNIQFSDTGFVFDEIGMVSIHDMQLIDTLLRERFNSELYMAGYPVLIMGDSAQCSPVCTDDMVKKVEFNKRFIYTKSFFDSKDYYRYTEKRFETQQRFSENEDWKNKMASFQYYLETNHYSQVRDLFREIANADTITFVKHIDDIPIEKDVKYLSWEIKHQDYINKKYIETFNIDEYDIMLKKNYNKNYKNGFLGKLIDGIIYLNKSEAKPISMEKYAGTSEGEIFRYNYASTIHSCQGNTYDGKLIIIMNGLYNGIEKMKLFYTAITRCKSPDLIQLYQIKEIPKI